MGYFFMPLNFQIPYFPQYIAMFTIGLIAYRGKWFLQIPEKTGKLWSRISAILLVLLAVFPALSKDPVRFFGGFYWQALLYALWEQLLCVAIIITLTVIFRKKYNNQGASVESMSASAYTVYIIHAPIIVILALSLRGIVLEPILKFVLVALLAVSICFILGNYIRRLPYLRNIF